MDEIKRKLYFNVLDIAEEEFAKIPDRDYYNRGGICQLVLSFGVSKDDLKIILGDKFKNPGYSFCEGLTQGRVYKLGRDDLKYERSEWCKKRKEDFRIDIN